MASKVRILCAHVITYGMHVDSFSDEQAINSILKTYTETCLETNLACQQVTNPGVNLPAILLMDGLAKFLEIMGQEDVTRIQAATFFDDDNPHSYCCGICHSLGSTLLVSTS
jgi:hypothetical protein